MIAGALFIAIVGVSIVSLSFVRLKKKEQQGEKQKKIFVILYSVAFLAIGGMSLFAVKIFLGESNYIVAVIFLVVFIVTVTISVILACDNEMKKNMNMVITLPTLGALLLLNLFTIKTKGNVGVSGVFSILSSGFFFPLLEETIFRGYIYNSFFPDSIALKRRILGFIVFSVIFSLSHSTRIPRVSDIPYFAILFLLSMFCFAGRYFAKIDKIGLPLFIHGAYNLIVLLYSTISFLSSTR
jgi:membrane protease YdiL (CAAX protease family)